MVGVLLEFIGHDLEQSGSTARCLSLGQPDAIGDTENVCVDGDRRLTEGGIEHDAVLRADAGRCLASRSCGTSPAVFRSNCAHVAMTFFALLR